MYAILRSTKLTLFFMFGGFLNLHILLKFYGGCGTLVLLKNARAVEFW